MKVWVFAAVVLCVAGQAPSLTTLEFATILFRHGDRTSLTAVPPSLTAAHKAITWPEGYGMLTNLGMQEQYQMGQMFSDRYGDFLGNTYLSSTFNAQSTDYDRTLMSAESQLAGWFPPIISPFDMATMMWQPVPVHTVPRSLDLLLTSGLSCPAFSHSSNLTALQAVKNAEWAPSDVCMSLLGSSECNNEEFVQALGSQLGVPLSGVDNSFGSVADSIMVLLAHNISLNPLLSDPVLPYILELAGWLMFSNYASNLQSRQLSSGYLLWTIVQQLSAKYSSSMSSQAQTQKIQLYSAHDITVASLLAGLDPNYFDLTDAPPYCAAVVIELHIIDSNPFAWVGLKYQTESGLFDETVLPITIPGCAELCPLNQLVSLLSPVMLSASQVQTQCGVVAMACGGPENDDDYAHLLDGSPATTGSPSSSSSSISSAYAAIVVILVLLACGVVVLGIVWYRRIRRRNTHKYEAFQMQPIPTDEELFG